MEQNIEKITVRRVGDSLYFRIPLSYWRKHNLKPGDAFFWFPREGYVILKRITPEIVAGLIEEEQEEAAVDAA
jgi:antitoxin component of MazEF toxin-antitoxin module